MFTRAVGYSNVLFARATPTEISDELARAGARKSVQQRHRTFDEYCDPVDSAASKLNKKERSRVRVYGRMYPNDACDAMQNPKMPGKTGHTCRGKDNKLMCLARGMGLVWHPKLGRWYLISELLESMGFPTADDVTQKSRSAQGQRGRAPCPYQNGSQSLSLSPGSQPPPAAHRITESAQTATQGTQCSFSKGLPPPATRTHVSRGA